MHTRLPGRLTWVGHATFLLETPAGRRVLLEGFVESCPTCPEALRGANLGPLDAIIVSHGHVDHVADLVGHAQRTGATVAAQVELAGWLGSQGVADDQLVAFNKGGTVELCEGVRATMTHARHSSSTPDGTYAGEAAGYVLELEEGYRIYHAGDTDLFGDMELIGRLHAPDLALLPIGGFYTMDPRQAALAVPMLGASEVAGMHWGTFPVLEGRPEELVQRVGGAAHVHQLQPGETIGELAAALR